MFARLWRPAESIAGWHRGTSRQVPTTTLPNGVVLSSYRDQLDRVYKVTADKAGTTLAKFEYGFTNDNQRQWMVETRYGASAGTARTDWTYDALNRLTGETYDNDTASGLFDANDYAEVFSYNEAGNRTQKTLDNGRNGVDLTTVYTYDVNDRLQTETATGTNAYTTLYGHYVGSTWVPGYDANGSMVEANRTGTSPQASTSAYDLRNRLTNATVAGVATTYGYDSDGNRVSRTTTAGTSYVLVDGNNLTGYNRTLEESATQGGAPTVS